VDVAFDPHQFLFDQREHVGEAERRQRLPEFFPHAARGAQDEAVVGRDERPRRHLGDAAALDADQGISVVNGDHEGGVDEAAAPDQFVVGVHVFGDQVEHVLRLKGCGSVMLARAGDRGYLDKSWPKLPSSSGPGRRPLTAKTGVRVP
jgi:hypothetical protein